VAWGFAIITRVVDRHRTPGTFISAILLLLEVRWRTSINRSPKE